MLSSMWVVVKQLLKNQHGKNRTNRIDDDPFPFDETWGEDKFEEAYAQGFRPKLTRISEEFTFEDFKAQHGEGVVVILVIDKNGLVHINTADFDLEPSAEQSVVALVKTEAAASV